MRRIYQLTLLLLIPLSAYSQKSIYGTVLDKETKEPIAYAHIFLNDSSAGTFSDLDGSFFFKKDEQSRANELIITHVSYELTSVELGDDALGEILIAPKNDQLKDVQVSGEVDSKWQKKYDQFKEELFGTTPFAERCKILNPWVIDFSKKQGSFLATANEPIEIANDALGYRISFKLDFFTIRNRVVTIKGVPINVRDNSASEEQLLEFERNRRIAFEGSIYHFAQSVANNSLEENGYEVFIAGDELVQVAVDRKSSTKWKVNSIDRIVNKKSEYAEFDFDEYLQIVYRSPITNNSELSWIKKEGHVFISENGLVGNLDSLKLFGSFANDRLANYLTFDQIKSYYKKQVKSNSLAGQIKSHFPNAGKSEELYIHTDREVYFPGEDIWLKGYLHSEDSASSKKLFLELAGIDSSIVKTILPIQGNSTSGYLKIPENISPGTFMVLGYTDQDINSNQNHFKKPIQIGYWDKANPKSSKKEIKIYPEGGSLVSEIINNVAFVIKDENGVPFNGAVDLYEESNKLMSVKSEWNGRGVFKIIPKQKTKYSLRADDKNIVPLNFTCSDQEIGMIAQDLDSIFRVNIQSNRVIKDTVYVTTSNKNNLLSIYPVYLYKTHQLLIPKKQLEDGVNTITIFDEKIRPVSERVVYVQPQLVDLELEIKSKDYLSKVMIKGTDSIKDASMSAIDLSRANDQGSESILVNKYLRPEISGWIENSDALFNQAESKHFDLVMLTNGWRKYSTNLVEPVDSTTSISQSGFSLIGSVIFKNPNKATTGDIFLINQNSKSAMKFNSVDENGNFFFKDIHYTDSSSLYFAFDKKFAKNVKGIELSANHNWKYQEGISFDFEYHEELSNERRKIDFENRLSSQKSFDTSEATELEEVVVFGKEGSSLKKRRYAVTSAEVLSFKEKPITGYGRNTYTTIDQIKSVKTIYFYEVGRAIIRDVKLINTEVPDSQRNEIDLYVDNSFTDPLMLLYLDPANFERIEFVRTYSKNGALFIYTRDTPIKPPRKQVFEKKLKGYQAKKEFFEEKLLQPPSRHTATIHWDPHITSQKRSISFSAPTEMKPVKVIVEGFTLDDKPFRLIQTYTSN